MIEIRSCAGFEELEACVKLQIETWGYDWNDLVSRKSFHLAQKIGGQVIGAFDSEPADGNALAGFVMSLPGIRQTANGPRPYLHSHMLAVRPAYRNRGLGVQLKCQQRTEALSRGIRRMQWTFDPLEIKNAFLNIHKLGVTARTYLTDFYGVSSSRLQGGLPTDRLLAEWEMDSARVEAALARRQAAPVAIEERIVVPAAIGEWKRQESTREKAQTVQSDLRQKFQKAFTQGLAVVGFSLDSDKNGVYELGQLPQS